VAKNKNMLSIKNLRAGIEGKEIIKGFDLEVKAGELHLKQQPVTICDQLLKMLTNDFQNIIKIK